MILHCAVSGSPSVQQLGIDAEADKADKVQDYDDYADGLSVGIAGIAGIADGTIFKTFDERHNLLKLLE